ARNFNPEWGYVAPAPSVMRTDCLIVVAAIILAAAGTATVFSLLHRPVMEAPVAAHTLVASEVSRPVTTGAAVAAQQPTEPQEVKPSYVPRWGVWLAADLSESGAWALYHERVLRGGVSHSPSPPSAIVLFLSSRNSRACSATTSFSSCASRRSSLTSSVVA